MKNIGYFIGAALMFSSLGANAESAPDMGTNQPPTGPLLFHTESISYSYGENYEVDPSNKQNIITLEHASIWTWGDIYTFMDNIWYLDSNAPGSNYYPYWYINPRISLGKNLNTDLSIGPIKDVLVGFAYEHGKDTNKHYMWGPAIDLAVPGFQKLSVGLYYRRPDGISGLDAGQWQLTPSWHAEFPLGTSSIVFDGVIEWRLNDAGTEGTQDFSSKYFRFNPRIKYDIGKVIGITPRHLYAGVEVDYWDNKYAIKDGTYGLKTKQTNASALVSWKF